MGPGTRGKVIWINGMTGSGKSAVARRLRELLRSHPHGSIDILRKGLADPSGARTGVEEDELREVGYEHAHRRGVSIPERFLQSSYLVGKQEYPQSWEPDQPGMPSEYLVGGFRQQSAWLLTPYLEWVAKQYFHGETVIVEGVNALIGAPFMDREDWLRLTKPPTFGSFTSWEESLSSMLAAGTDNEYTRLYRLREKFAIDVSSLENDILQFYIEPSPEAHLRNIRARGADPLRKPSKVYIKNLSSIHLIGAYQKELYFREKQRRWDRTEITLNTVHKSVDDLVNEIFDFAENAGMQFL